MSPKFPEVFIVLRTLVFDGRQGAYPTSVEQQFRGPLVPGGLCAPSLRSGSPGIRRWGPNLALAPHSFALRPLCRVPVSLEFQLKTQAKLSLWAAILSYTLDFPQGAEERRGFWQLPGALRGPPGPSFRAAVGPTPASGPQMLASHGPAQGSRCG